MTKKGDIDFEAISKLCDNFNGKLINLKIIGADMRNVCTEAGMFAIRKQLEYVVQDDFMKAARKIKDTKGLESKLDYQKI
jgi:26S proteasome regulatory subunit T4